MLHTFLFKLTKLEITGSIGITFISLGNLIINFHFQNWKCPLPFFVAFTILLFNSGVCLPSNNRNVLNSKKITSQTAKTKFERERILRLFPEKNKINKTYIRIITKFISLKKRNLPTIMPKFTERTHYN